MQKAGPEADDTLLGATKALLFYYMWTARTLRTTKPSTNDPSLDYPEYTSFSSALLTIMETRHALSPVRIAAIGTLLDLHTLFATFRHKDAPLQSLVHPVDPAAEPLILATFTALEKAFAKKSHRKLDLTSPDDELESEPEDSDDEDALDAEDQDTAGMQQQALLAEQRLCEITGKIVLAIVGRVLDHSSPSRENRGKIQSRISQNRLKLGPNFKEVIAYLDGPPKATATGGRGAKRPARKGTAAAKKAAPVKGKSRVRVRDGDEDDSDDEDDDEGVELEEGGEEDLRGEGVGGGSDR